LTTQERDNCIRCPAILLYRTAGNQRTSPDSKRPQEMKHCGLTDKPRAGYNSEQLYHETSEIISAVLHSFSQRTLR